MDANIQGVPISVDDLRGDMNGNIDEVHEEIHDIHRAIDYVNNRVTHVEKRTDALKKILDFSDGEFDFLFVYGERLVAEEFSLTKARWSFGVDEADGFLQIVVGGRPMKLGHFTDIQSVRFAELLHGTLESADESGDPQFGS